MKKSRRTALFDIILGSLLFIVVSLICGTAIGAEDQKTKNQNNKDEFTLEEIIVTAQFQETKLQKTPLAITAITGDTLEKQNIRSIGDLGMVVPNADIRAQGNANGPNAQIGLRGVGQWDFIPAFEPGVGVYVDDIYQETLVGSNLDLLDLERIEVLRGPQGTLFGKNSLGGAIRLISKVPNGDNTGHFQVTGGTYDRLDINGAYDFSLIDNMLFMRISGSSKRIEGYMDRLDFTCQMIANGTPELAGSLPSTFKGDRTLNGDCKIGEKGGSQSNAGKIMLRFIPSDKLEINFGADHTEIVSDTGAQSLLRGFNPAGSLFDSYVQTNIIDPTWNKNEGDALTILGDTFVTGDPYTVYESFEDPINGLRWPDTNTEDFTNMFARMDYDITDSIQLKGIFGYREYEQIFTTVNGTPFSFNGYLVDMEHSQTSYEIRLNGAAFDKLLDWTTGAYYFESDHHFGGYVGLGTYGLWTQGLGIGPSGFAVNNSFTTDSKSAFAHAIFHITEKLSFTAGGRFTDESKTFTYHTELLQLAIPLKYGQSHWDYKLGVDYQFTEDIMAYFSASTGFRSEGANPRPFTQAQLQEITGEKILAYELGAKTDFFENRLRINAAAFINYYDPRQFNVFGAQCTAANDPSNPVYVFPYGTACPAGTAQAGTLGTYALVYLSAPGTSKGFEVDMQARPFSNLDINGSFGYYDFESDVGPDKLGYVHPDYKQQADYTYNLGAQYRILFSNGSTLIPRMDMYYQGERNNNNVAYKPIKPYHVVPDYTVYNARLTYSPASVRWSVSFEVQNLFDEFYWISLVSDRADNGVTPTYTRTGVPSPPRMFALTFRYNMF